MSVVALPSQPVQDGANTCPNCSATIVADQRYCLACGQPCTPTRLDFLDVLQADHMQTQTTVLPVPAYLPALEPAGAIGWLRRYSGLLALLGVLLTTGLIGLLIGHWTKPTPVTGPQVIKVEGLPAVAAAEPTAAASTTTATSTTAKQTPQSKSQEEKEVKETEASTVKAPPPAKVDSSSLKKLSKTTGKTHQKEIESLTAGGKPIETGG